MTNKQLRQLKLLDGMIQGCKQCGLYKNGRCKPHYSKYSKFAMILEAPGRTEVEDNTPVVGKAGEKLWNMMNYFGFKRSDFLIINSVNCRPIDGNKNGKPSTIEISSCRKWVRKYLKVLKPEKMILFGKYSLLTIMNKEYSIIKHNATSVWSDEFKCNAVISVHPAYTIYNKDNGKIMLYNSINKFKNIHGKDNQ